MAPRRRLSFDFMIPRAAVALSDSSSSSDAAVISKYALHHEVIKAECECCSLAEDCTRAYEKQVKGRMYGRWLCGLCSEAVKVEIDRSGLHPRQNTNINNVKEEAILAHMEVCKKFNKTVRMNPAMSLACAMAEILKKSSLKRVVCTSSFYEDGDHRMHVCRGKNT